jgi:hypothetical protein
MPPISVMPTAEAARSCRAARRLMGRVASKDGAGETDSRIGAKLIETRIEGMMNSMNPAGSPHSGCPARHEAGHLHQHVGRQRLAARLVGGRVVEPAFGGDIDARDSENPISTRSAIQAYGSVSTG